MKGKDTKDSKNLLKCFLYAVFLEEAAVRHAESWVVSWRPRLAPLATSDQNRMHA